jgi:pilus assembly protein CpaB
LTAAARRRRGWVRLALALACGGLAAAQVKQRVEAVEGRAGPLVPVVVATRDLPADAELGRGRLAVRRVPARFAPPGAIADPAEAAGARLAAAVSRGDYLTAGAIGAGADGGRTRLRPGERALEVAVSGAAALAEAAAPGSRVDVLVSSEPHDGAGRSFLALESVELLGLRPGAEAPTGAAADDRSAATATATLRVTLRQAVYLTAAQNFARELRLLPRPPGDDRRAGRASVEAGGL